MLGPNKYGRVPAALLLFVTLPGSSAPRIVSRARLNWPLSPLSDCPARHLNYIIETSWQQSTATSCEQSDQAAVTVDSFPSTTLVKEDSTITAIPQSQTSLDASLLRIPTSREYEGTKIHGSKSAALSLSAAVENSTESGATIDVDRDNDGDSPLDNANFLSFEEWKKQNLAKAGQSVENLGGRAGTGQGEPRRRPGNINNALDSLGEDAELEIDFGGFGRPGKTAYSIPSQNAAVEDNNSAAENVQDGTKRAEAASVSYSRGKDAGKTCKERFNYASFDCAATVLKTNKESKGSTSMLVENKDSYMLNQCSADNKFFIVELCEDILVDTIVLANFEFFSSMFRTFRVSVSDRYPVKLDKWRELGTFEARNSREVQAFLVGSPLIWARYIRFEFLTHYGNEYYCPVSLLRVHGTTMMEEFNHEMKGMREEEEAENENGEGEDEESMESGSHVIIADALKEVSPTASKQAEENETTSFASATLAPPSPPPLGSLQEEAARATSNPDIYPTGFTFFESLLGSRMEAAMLALDDHSLVCQLSDQKLNTSPTLTSQVSTSYSPTGSGGMDRVSEPIQTSISSVTNLPGLISARSVESSSSYSISGSEHPHAEGKTFLQYPPKAVSQTSQVGARISISATQPQAANPTTQESFFKSVHKRLQLLESNSTLSLLYIEEQSRILRDAFSKVEKRQLAKTTAFLESLNTTVLNEIHAFRSQYDRIWQTTILELSSQREQSRNDVIALSARLSVLADEIVFQKRMAILQFVLMVLCFGLVLFSRAFSSSSAALLQNVVDMSSANPARYAHFETPRSSPSSTRPSSRYGIFGRGSSFATSASEESASVAVAVEGTNGCRDGNRAWNAANSPSIECSPPTPTSLQAGEDEKRQGGDEIGEDDSLGFGAEDYGRPMHFLQHAVMLGESTILRRGLTEENNESHED